MSEEQNLSTGQDMPQYPLGPLVPLAEEPIWKPLVTKTSKSSAWSWTRWSLLVPPNWGYLMILWNTELPIHSFACYCYRQWGGAVCNTSFWEQQIPYSSLWLPYTMFFFFVGVWLKKWKILMKISNEIVSGSLTSENWQRSSWLWTELWCNRNNSRGSCFRKALKDTPNFTVNLVCPQRSAFGICWIQMA